MSNEQKSKVYRHLTIKIVASCTLLTSTVMLGTCLIAYHSAAKELSNATYNMFASKCQTVQAYLSSGPQIDTEELLRFTGQNQLAVLVVDNGQLLTFAPTTESEQIEKLVEQVKKHELLWDIYTPQKQIKSETSSFVLDEDLWYIAYQTNYNSVTQWYNILILQPATENNNEIFRLRKTYIFVFVTGVSILFVIALIFAKHVTRPVKEMQQQQLRFLASASHELKSPLTVISSTVDMLKRKLGNQDTHYQNIQSEIQHMAHLIDDMLVLTNGSVGQWTLIKQNVFPEDIVLSAYELYVSLMKGNRQTLLVELPDESTPSILADEERLRQILAVFLDNAYTYAPPESCITLRLSATSRHIDISVIDQGPGIPDQEKKTIFSYFSRAEQASSRSGHYGLGLAVAMELAKLHGGVIQLTDTPGGGATFTLILPITHS